MRIPKRFKLMGKTIEVIYVPTLRIETDSRGSAAYRMSEIRLQSSSPDWPISEADMGQTFCHEFVHHLFNTLAEDELRSNEKLVELMGSLLHQALTTMEYEDEISL